MIEVLAIITVAAFGGIVFLSWYDCHLAEKKAEESLRELNKWRYIHAVIVRPKKRRCK